VTEEEWAEKFNQITAEHKKAGACDQLLVGWKQWLAAWIMACAGEGSAAADRDQGQVAALNMTYLAD
jgi:hypothetical protein